MSEPAAPPPLPTTQASLAPQPPPAPQASPAPQPPPAPQPAADPPTDVRPSPGPAELSFTCTSCGSQIAYAAGTTTLRCTSCGAVAHIADEGTVVEHSYDEWAARPAKPVATIGEQVLACQNCGANTETDDIAGSCQFCGGVLVSLAQPEGLIAPEAVVPFHVDKRAANTAFTTWVRSRRFAPSALRQVGSTEAIKGTYVPHWTYDSQTDTSYRGQRGDYYYETETYQVSDDKGGTRTETRQVRRTRWRRAAGEVSRSFDDVLVPASQRIEAERLTAMGPWTLGDARAYQPQYLAGYSALRYDVDPDAGLAIARREMETTITEDCRRDIGGDEQRVRQMDVRYRSNMFKLVLLPLWIASYVFAGTTYQVLVNANTGEVVGDRPYSKLKIALTVLAALVLVAAIVAVVLIARK